MSIPSLNSAVPPVNRCRLLASAAGLALAAVAAACGSSPATTSPPAASANKATEPPAAVASNAAVPPAASPAAEPVDPLAASRPLAYDPDDRDSILLRYQQDRARVDSVLAAGVPVLWVTDAIW